MPKTGKKWTIYADTVYSLPLHFSDNEHTLYSLQPHGHQEVHTPSSHCKRHRHHCKKHHQNHHDEKVDFWLNINGQIGKVKTGSHQISPHFSRTSIKLAPAGEPTYPPIRTHEIQPVIGGILANGTY
jgi:hypothetical protein